jgi:2,3,4,5-tetrahydropyridine-2-carboxylate N-succinyltransferase
MTQQLQQTIDAAWEDRANLSPAAAPPKCARPSST